MSRLTRLAGVFDTTLAFDSGKFHAGLVPEDVKKWDSLGHMAMVAGLEKEFGLQFEVDEIMEMVTVASILEVLERKGVPEGT